MKINNFLPALAALVLAGCAATAPTVSPTAKSELAPGGTMRMAIITGNSLHAVPGTSGVNMKGLAPDIGRELARSLGATFNPVGYVTAAALLEGGKKGEWDVAFVGYSPDRLADMEFTPVVINGENTYLVRDGSTLRSVADVDREGITVATSERTAQEVHLRKTLKRAKVVSFRSQDETIAAVMAGRADAAAGNRHSMVEARKGIAGARLLDGSFLDLPYVVAVKKGRTAGAAYATDFVQYLKASGELAATVSRANLSGVRY